MKRFVFPTTLLVLLLALTWLSPAQAQSVDSDGDGILNALEISGFRFDVASGAVEACTPHVDDPCYVTDPLSWSSDGDPYSDFQEASGVNMDATVRKPYNSPLVAAYPVIEVVLHQYTFTSNASITDTDGTTLSSGESFTSSVESTTTSSVTVGVGASADGLSLSAEGTYSYSETAGFSATTTAGKELNWETATSTDLNDAGKPDNLLNVVMPRQATLFMTSPDPEDPGAAIRNTTFTEDMLNIRAAAVPRAGLPIMEAQAHVFQNGLEQIVPLVLAENGAYWTTEGNGGEPIYEPIGAASSYVMFTDVAGMVQRSEGLITMPFELASSCAEVPTEDLTNVVDGAGKAITFPNGNLDIPVEVLCKVGLPDTHYWFHQSTDVAKGGDVRDVVVLDEDTAVAVGSSLVLRTEDRGRTWTRIGGIPSGSWSEVDYRPGSGTLIAIGRVSEQIGTIMRSTDGGFTWTKQSGTVQAVFHMEFAGGQTWFYGGGAGAIASPHIRRSTNDGQTWSNITLPSGTRAVTDILFIDEHNGFFTESDFGGNKSKIYRTTDGGTSWEKVFELGHRGIGTISYAGDNTFFVGKGVFLDNSRPTMFCSTEGGDTGTWESIYMDDWGLDKLGRNFFATPELGFVAASNGLFRTEDGGETWTSEPNISGTYVTIPQALFDRNRIIATGGLTGIAMTTSGGAGMPIRTVSIETPEPIDPVDLTLPFTLGQNYPNPFQLRTQIVYSLEEIVDVTVQIYDMLGREVANLLQQTQSPGSYEVPFDASHLPAGMYMVRLRAGDRFDARPITLVK